MRFKRNLVHHNCRLPPFLLYFTAAADRSVLRDKTTSVLAYRGFVIKQILTAERAFLQTMLGAQSRFIDPLRAVPWLSTPEKQTLLDPLADISTLHQQLLRELTSAAELPSELLGKVFVEAGTQLALTHLHYAACFASCTATLNMLCRDDHPEMCAFLMSRPTPPTLAACFEHPFEILLQLKDLLHILLQHTGAAHSDHANVKVGSCILFAATKHSTVGRETGTAGNPSINFFWGRRLTSCVCV